MKLSAYLYLAGFGFSSAAIITEIIEKHRERKARKDIWKMADEWVTDESSSSQSVPPHSESSSTT